MVKIKQINCATCKFLGFYGCIKGLETFTMNCDSYKLKMIMNIDNRLGVINNAKKVKKD